MKRVSHNSLRQRHQLLYERICCRQTQPVSTPENSLPTEWGDRVAACRSSRRWIRMAASRPWARAAPTPDRIRNKILVATNLRPRPHWPRPFRTSLDEPRIFVAPTKERRRQTMLSQKKESREKNSDRNSNNNGSSRSNSKNLKFRFMRNRKRLNHSVNRRNNRNRNKCNYNKKSRVIYSSKSVRR